MWIFRLNTKFIHNFPWKYDFESKGMELWSYHTHPWTPSESASGKLTNFLCSVAVFTSPTLRALVTCCQSFLDSNSPCMSMGRTRLCQILILLTSTSFFSSYNRTEQKCENLFQKKNNIHTDNPFYTDTRYNDKIHYNDNFSVTRPSRKW